MLKNTKSNLKSIVIANEVKQSRQIATPSGLAITESGRSTSSLSFPCLTRESIGRGLNAPHFTRFTQSGRSMVEMLGVLAVMGIISIGGLYGYTYAMKRHRANELLNEANKRAVMVASQFMTGRDPENVKTEEFPEETPYGTFSANITSDGNDKFKMTVSGLDEKTCDLLKSFTGGPLRRVSCQKSGTSFTAELFFNKDLSTSEKASDFNGDPDHCPGKYCTGSNTCVDTGASCTCSGTMPECQTCNTDTGSYVADSSRDGKPCNLGAGTCQSGSCETLPACLDNTSGVKCLSNTEDKNGNSITLCSGYYCEVGGECDGGTYRVTAGDITPLPLQPISKNGNGYHRGGYMTWDAAYYYCQALKDRGDITSGLAGKNNSNLRDDGAYWVNSLYPSGSIPTSNNSCTALFVNFNYGVSPSLRNGENFEIAALCE